MYITDKKTGINYFTDCEVYLVANTKMNLPDLYDYTSEYGLGLQDRNLLDEAKHDEFIIELAGRHCYMSFNEKMGTKTLDGYIKNIIDQGHYSVLEHLNLTFIFRGISRYCTHELVRHRHLSPSQFSTRYCDSINFVVPVLMRSWPNLIKDFLTESKHSLDNYHQKVNQIFLHTAFEKIKSDTHLADLNNKFILSYKDKYSDNLLDGHWGDKDMIGYYDDTKLERMMSLLDSLMKEYKYKSRFHLIKDARSAARAFLIGEVEAPIVVTGNVRAWREAISKRTTDGAEYMIMDLFEDVKTKLIKTYPVLGYKL